MTTVYTFNNKVLKNSANDKWLTKAETPIDPYNPLGLPDNTLRIEVTEGSTVNVFSGTSTQISSSPNVWEISDPNGTGMPYFYLSSGHVLKVLGAKRKLGDATSDYAWSQVNNDASYITYVGSVDLIGYNSIGVFKNMSNLTHIGNINVSDLSSFEEMFYACASLVEIGQVQMKSGVTNFNSCFGGCNSITALPTLNLTSATNVSSFMADCYLYPHPLAIYSQLSNMGAQITNHSQTFYNCGRDSVTGTAELAQIPSDWK